jgi:ornithine cyclodeaminase
LPHSSFLRFPDNATDRIIALPAYLGDGFKVAGIKWVSSFPGNLNRGYDRASAVVILNSTSTGRPEAIIEGSMISAKRTAASAALAAVTLAGKRAVSKAAIIGCGLINFEIVRFLRAAIPDLASLTVFDLDADRARQFKDKCLSAHAGISVELAADLKSALGSSNLISFATTAIKPHVFDISSCDRNATILHISLRDLAAEVIIASENIVDDVDHVCRAETSVHLAEQLTGNRDFIKCALADLLKGRMKVEPNGDRVRVFSPFGLGILDLAVSKLVRDLGLKQQRGTIIDSFLTEPWAASRQG